MAQAADRSQAEWFSQRLRERLSVRQLEPPLSLRLHLAHASSRLGHHLDLAPDAPPYWAYLWAGGLALAYHVAEHPNLVRGRHVLDFGSGSGIVAICAARNGAASVTAVETDLHAAEAIALNAAANDVSLQIVRRDFLQEEQLPKADLVLAGDVFYDPVLAPKVFALLQRFQAQGAEVLVGDPGRTALPVAALHKISDYDVADFGLGKDERTLGGVFAIRGKQER